MTKQFTAIAILMLVEEGKLSLTDEVSQFYPEWFSDKSPITVRHLLSHTAGIVDLSRIKAVRSLMTVNSKPDSIIQIISREALNFTPGDQYEYSNSGYVVLGGILEKVSGLSYKRFLNDKIFQPLGMSRSHFANRDQIEDQLALGYFTRPDTFVNAPEISSSLLFAAGGLWSTIEDMARWNEALYTNRLVSQKYLRMAFTPNQLNGGVFTDYGFGFRQCKVNDVESIEHGGGVFGYSSYGIRMEKQGVYVVLLSNFERNNPYDELTAKIAALTIDKPFDHATNNKRLHEKQANKYLGAYMISDGDTLHISIKDNGLFLLSGKEEMKLQPIKKHLFLIEGSLDDRLTFARKKPHTLRIKGRRSMAVNAIKLN